MCAHGSTASQVEAPQQLRLTYLQLVATRALPLLQSKQTTRIKYQQAFTTLSLAIQLQLLARPKLQLQAFLTTPWFQSAYLQPTRFNKEPAKNGYPWRGTVTSVTP